MNNSTDIKARLTDESPEVRRRAVVGLTELDPDEIVDLLNRALADDDWRVRKEAVITASKIGTIPRLIDRLIDAILQEDNVGLRNAAAEALVMTGEDTVDIIIERYAGLSAAGRKIAIEVLGAFRNSRVLQMLIDALEDEDFNVQACAAEWLGEQGGDEAITALESCMDSSDPLLTLTALQSLNRLRARIPWDKLNVLAKEPIYGAELLMALGRSGRPEAAALIGVQLDTELAAARAMTILHGFDDPCAEAVEAILRDADDDVYESLLKWTREGEPSEQQAAVNCLLWSKQPRHIEAIVKLAQRESIFPFILEELKRWGQTAIDMLEDLQKHLQGKNLASTIRLFAQLLEDDAGREKAALFAAYLGSADLAVATSAAGAVSRFGDPSVLPRLIELLEAPDERVRRVAGHALIEVGRRYPEATRSQLSRLEIEGLSGIQLCRVIEVVGTPEDAPRLAAACSSPLPELRSAVLRALATVAGENALKTIALALTDENISVRIAAATALAQIGAPAAETIVSALRTASGPLQASLIRSLGRVGHPEAVNILRGMCRGSADVALAALEAMQQLGLELGESRDEILTHPDAEVIKQALELLGIEVNAKELIGLLAHDAWDVRLTAVERLELFTAEEAVRQALKSRFEVEDNDLVQETIVQVLAAKRKARYSK